MTRGGQGRQWLGRRRRAPTLLLGTALVAGSIVAVATIGSPAGASAAPGGTGGAAATCPWTSALARLESPEQLAAEVVAKMTLREKVGIVDLAAGDGYENIDTGVPSLCIPALTLQDGPAGLAEGDTGVTQLPAPIALAATFQPELATRYGRVLGAEARGQGIDVVQAPNLDLVRVPESGRSFETFGEDPMLASLLGVAEVRGIQSQGTMSELKHYSAYTQETDRQTLDQQVSQRALAEVYDAPFRAAVEQAGAAAAMCSYGAIDGTPTCENHAVLNSLKRLRAFTGFVRSDEAAVTNPVAAFQAGMDMIKPPANAVLAAAVADGRLAPSRLDNAVERILTEEFAFGLIDRPPHGAIDDVVRTAQHSEVALEVAEQSIVLLKDSSDVLPLEPGPKLTLALIGTGAGSGATTTGGGGATVVAPFTVSPLQALTAALGAHQVLDVPAMPSGPSSVIFAPHASGAVPVTLFDDTASVPGSGPGWRSTAASFTAAASGTYEISMSSYGDSFLSMDGAAVQSDGGIETWSSAETTTATVELQAHTTYHFVLDWFSQVPSQPVVSVENVSGAIASAVAAARSVEVPIVFAHDDETEGEDRPNLSLPGYQDALIRAVAAANPRTVVVLNTGGAVLVPWLHDVAALVEAWYPGEEDGNALAAVLLGRVDPSGRLPVTFPVSQADQPLSTPSEWPGIDGSVAFDDGLDIGYRGYLAEGKRMRFPFGFGLSYTRFTLSDLAVDAAPGGDTASVVVDNVGDRAGREVVEAYLAFPPGAGEPPEQLVAVGSVELAPGASATVSLELPGSVFEADPSGHWRTLSGSYELSVGTSAARPVLQATVTAPA